MKFIVVLCIVLAMSYSTFGASENVQPVALRSRRDLMETSIRIVQELIENLQKTAREALDSVGKFTANLVTEAEKIRDKIVLDMQTFRNRVTSAVEDVFERFSNTSNAVKKCVESQRDQASYLFNDTVTLTMTCVDQRVSEVSDMVDQLKSLATNAMDEATAIMENIKKCSQDNSNLLNAGTCLGNEVIRAEMESVSFLSQSTLLVGRINLALATLPGFFEVCAGTRLIETGIQTGRIIMEMGTCSASVIYNYMAGKD